VAYLCKSLCVPQNVKLSTAFRVMAKTENGAALGDGDPLRRAVGAIKSLGNGNFYTPHTCVCI